jgi:DNA-binding NarL/FixJ family response regulator
MDLGQIVALARHRISTPPFPTEGNPVTPPGGTEGAIPPHSEGLTQRELDVLRLLAEGLTDGQVAERLYLSRRTVNAHVRSIYTKLGITTRSAATRYAIEHNLT